MKKNLSKIVIPTLDSNYGNYHLLEKAKIYNKYIDGEQKLPTAPKCFLGAWYHKVYSAKDKWLGIEGTITLGEFTPDIERFGFDGRVDFKRDLDSPSIYMGGNAISESDAGLGFMSGYLNKDEEYDLDYGSPKVAFRPFWRFIYNEAIDIGGNVERKNVNSWNITNPKQFDFYYFPGDKIKMTVYAPLKDYLQLRIEVIETTNIEKYKKIRTNLGIKKPKLFLSPLFYSEGHLNTLAEFKRVNSIDQYGNEGFVVKETNALMKDSIWHDVNLFRDVDGEVVRVPFNDERSVVMTCPNSESFTLEKIDESGEKITIKPVYKL